MSQYLNDSLITDLNTASVSTDELRKWAKALLSGKYVQNLRRLRNLDDKQSMCCLGVLCDIHPDEGKWTGAFEAQFTFNTDSLTYSASLPSYRIEQLLQGGEELALPLEKAFVDANDEEGLTFEQIGDWLLSAADTIDKLRQNT